MKYILGIILINLCSFSSLAQKAPDFSLQTEQGQTISLSDYQGKPLILHFWATWCPYCRKLQPGLDKLYLKYKDQGLEMLAISLWEDAGARPQAVLIKRGLHFTTVLNGEEAGKQYQVKGTPTTVFIKKNGEVLGVTGISDPNAPVLEQAVQAIIN